MFIGAKWKTDRSGKVSVNKLVKHAGLLWTYDIGLGRRAFVRWLKIERIGNEEDVSVLLS